MLGVLEGSLLSCLLGCKDWLGGRDGWLLVWLDGCVDMLGLEVTDGLEDG